MNRQPATTTRTPALSARDAEIIAANAAYLATLALPPLTAAQAGRIRAIATAASARAETHTPVAA